MTPKRKNLMHKVINDQMALVPIMHQLDRYTHCDKFLTWLIRNKITGQNLVEWLKIYHNNSIMNMVKFIIKTVEKSKDLPAIIYNKDWV